MTAINFHLGFAFTTDFMHARHISPSGCGRYQQHIQKKQDHAHNKRPCKLLFAAGERGLSAAGQDGAESLGKKSEPVVCAACSAFSSDITGH